MGEKGCFFLELRDPTTTARPRKMMIGRLITFILGPFSPFQGRCWLNFRGCRWFQIYFFEMFHPEKKWRRCESIGWQRFFSTLDLLRFLKSLG